MQKGFDSQASLYRAMLASGGPKNAEKTELAARLKAAAETGVVYYLLNDQVALSDIAPPGAERHCRLAGARRRHRERGAGADRAAPRGGARRDASRSIARAIAEFFEKEAGIKPYALEASPLIGAVHAAG